MQRQAVRELLGFLDRVAVVMDDRFRVPGTGIRFGLDPVIGMIPGVGDSVTAGVGIYTLLWAKRAGVPLTLLGWMLANLALDWVVGLVPVLGDLFDVGFKAHRRNATLLRRYAERSGIL